MNVCVLFGLCVLTAVSVSGNRVRRSNGGSLILRASPVAAVINQTDEIKITCQPPSSIQDIMFAVMIQIEKFEENATESTVIASKKIDKLTAPDDNRTVAEATLQSSRNGDSSEITVTIHQPMASDAGTYQCTFAYLDDTIVVHTLTANVSVTVSETGTQVFQGSAGCDCDLIWEEINNIKNTLVRENAELRSQTQGAVAAGGGAEAPGSCKVSFSARFESEFGYMIVSDAVAQFDTIISNKGGAYDAGTGTFTAPCAGQYFISATLRSHTSLDSGYVDGEIQVDGEARAKTSVFTATNIENFQSATNGVVLNLEQGQEVKVVIKTTSTGEFVGGVYSVFSGFYLFP